MTLVTQLGAAGRGITGHVTTGQRIIGLGQPEAPAAAGCTAENAGSTPPAGTGTAQGRDDVCAQRLGVLVLGMHRSGTSALARMFSMLGCDLPANLMAPDTGNDLGHWESNAVVTLNDQALSSAGSGWDDWLPLNPGWYASPVYADFVSQARAVLRADYGASRLFVMKDPRNCRLMRFWLEAFAAEGVTPVVALPLRNPLEVAESLAARDGMDVEYGLLLWLRHVLEAERATRGLARAFCSYEQMLDDWPQVAAKMQQGLGLSWPRRSLRVDREISAFLAGAHRHHHASAQAVLGNAAISPWVRRGYAVFARWAESGEAAADWAELDAILAEFDSAGPGFAPLVLGNLRQSQGFGVAARERSELAEQLAAARQRLGEAEAALIGLRQEQELEQARKQQRAKDSTAEADKMGQAALSVVSPMADGVIAEAVDGEIGGDAHADRAAAETADREPAAADRPLPTDIAREAGNPMLWSQALADDAMARQLAAQQAEVERLVRQNDALAARLLEQDERLTARIVEAQTATSRLRELEQELARLQAAGQAASQADEAQRAQLVAALADIDAALVQARGEVGQARGEVADLVQEREGLTQDRDRIEAECGNLSSGLASALAERDEALSAAHAQAGLAQNLVETQAVLAEATEQAGLAWADAAAWREAFERIEARNGELEHGLASREAALAERDSLVAERDMALAMLRDEVTAARSAAEQTQERLDHARGEAAVWREAAERVGLEREALALANAKLEAALGAAHSTLTEVREASSIGLAQAGAQLEEMARQAATLENHLAQREDEASQAWAQVAAMADAQRAADTAARAEAEQLVASNTLLAKDNARLLARSEQLFDRNARLAESLLQGGEHLLGLSTSLRAAEQQAASDQASLTQEQQARGEAEVAAQRLQQSCKGLQMSLEQRCTELANLSRLYAEAENEAARLAQLHAQTEGELAAAQAKAEQLAEAKVQVARLTQEIAGQQAVLDSMASALAAAQTAQHTAEARLTERFGELAGLTRELMGQAQQIEAGSARAAWLQNVSAALLAGDAWWWSFMPPRWRRQRQLAQLREKGMFDASDYLARYPDVAGSRMDPLRHYLLHGMREGRVH